MIWRELPIEVLLAAGYAVFLLGVAAILEKLAGHSRHRADQYELAGFRYHAGFDHWECPEGNHLVRVETDQERRTVRYRAPAHHCNACHCKPDCTDSDNGREIEHQFDLWLRTGLHQFHRGLSLALIILAGLLLLVEALRYPEAHSITLLGGLFVVAVCVAARFCWAPQNGTTASPGAAMNRNEE